MKVMFRKHICLLLCLVFLSLPTVFRSQSKDQELKNAPPVSELFSRVKALGKWQLLSTIHLDFTTFHPQGLTKIGDYFYLSSVRTIRPPQKYPTPQNGYDRDQGEGIGYLFKFGQDGKLIKSITLGRDAIYHPGGIDFDETNIWVPVCEYRPFGKSIIYTVNPETLEAQVVTTVPDAIGAVAYNRERNQLLGMNWGSRLFYKWNIDSTSRKPAAILQKETGDINPHFYVDFQDCKYSGKEKMLCSGLSTYKNQKSEFIRLGGLELIDMNTYAAHIQIPVAEYTKKGVVITNNPFYVDVARNRLLYYFIPEDDDSSLYIYSFQ